MKNQKLIDKLARDNILTREQFISLISDWDDDDRAYAARLAREISQSYFGNRVYIRGLIEFTNYCKNDCYYCGLRASNKNAQRYRLTQEDILSCCKEGYRLGFRTFVLQGGEDTHFSDSKMCDIIRQIKAEYPDCALTLSLGERDRESYEKMHQAGADRYLLRHETADNAHYARLHPQKMSLEHRKQCLRDLRDIGFQTGCGFMVGSPESSPETLAEDFLFIHELDPQMIGIGPFLPHCDTPFANEPQGNLELTLFLLSLLRIMQKQVLLPATTALGTIHPKGREMGILAGANVVMPNLSPLSVRKKYMLYDKKICTGEEAAECISCLSNRMQSIGYEIVTDRGDYKKEQEK